MSGSLLVGKNMSVGTLEPGLVAPVVPPRDKLGSSPYSLSPTSSIRDVSSLPGYYQRYVHKRTTTLEHQPRQLQTLRIYLYEPLREYSECIQNHKKMLLDYKTTFKHGGEVWFLEQVERSPFRTHNSSEADLFVIPVHPGFVVSHNVCTTEAKATIQHIRHGVRKEEWATATLRNHVLLSTHWKAERVTVKKKWCKPCIHMQQGNRRDDVVAVDVPMFPQLYSKKDMTSLTPEITRTLREQTTAEFLRTRSHPFYFAGQSDRRKEYTGRRRVQQAWNRLNARHRRHRNSSSTTTSTMVGLSENASSIDDFMFILTKPKPPPFDFARGVSTTRFGYHGRGDKPNSSRLYEWIDVGAIPVIVIDDAFLPGFHVPWDEFTIRIPERYLSLEGKEPESLPSLEDEFERIAYNLSESEITRMRSVLRMYAPALLWSASDSVVAEVMLIDAWEVYQNTSKNERTDQQARWFWDMLLSPRKV